MGAAGDAGASAQPDDASHALNPSRALVYEHRSVSVRESATPRDGAADPVPQLHGPFHLREGDVEEGIVERDPHGRFARYDVPIGEGKFKTVFKAFDDNKGVDVAWSKIYVERLDLDDEERQRLREEVAQGRTLAHDNIIRMLKVWVGEEDLTVNFVTELFTSGNLRQFRKKHKDLELKTLRKFGRQILGGLQYLHSQTDSGRPLVHGDPRCDKIYVNGNRGEIKIGDLGLATLQARRYGPPDVASLDANVKTKDNEGDWRVDIFAFGLCMLELITLEQLSPGCSDEELRGALDAVGDPEAADLIAKCLGPREQRPSAGDLLDHPFFRRKGGPGDGSDMSRVVSERHITESHSVGASISGRGDDRPPLERSASRVGHPPRTIDLDSPNGPADGLVRRNSLNADTDFKRGQLSGMEWMFQFWGRRPTVAGSVHGAEGESPTGRMPSGKLDMVAKLSRLPGPGEAVDGDRPLTLRFEFDPAIDSASIIAKELAEQLQFKKVDQEICESALSEVLNELKGDRDVWEQGLITPRDGPPSPER